MIIAEHIGERIRFVMKSEKTKADSLRTARHCFTILLLFILAGCFSFVIGAQENGARQEMEQTREGSCGNGVNWSLDEDGVLRIYGKGEMEDYDKDKTVPWREVGSYVKSVMVEEGVSKIGRSAFYGLENLENAAAAKSVRTIGDWAFSHCGKLSSVSLEEGLVTIGEWSFYYDKSLTEIKIPDSTEEIGNFSFGDCDQLVRAFLGENIHSIPDNMFSGCYALEQVDLPEKISSIGENAFYLCENLKEDNLLPDGITRIGKNAFCGCSSLTRIRIPDKVTVIEKSTFEFCSSLSEVELGNGVQSIGKDAFRNCESLESIVFPDSLQSLEDNSFTGCSNLTEVTIGKGFSDFESLKNSTRLTGIFAKDDNPNYCSVDGILFSRDLSSLVYYLYRTAWRRSKTEHFCTARSLRQSESGKIWRAFRRSHLTPVKKSPA